MALDLFYWWLNGDVTWNHDVDKGENRWHKPMDVLHVGLFQNFGLSIGTWSIVTGLFIVASTSIVLRQWPKIGTWLNMLLIGSFIDVFNWMLPSTDVYGLQITYFIIGLFVLSFGCGCILHRIWAQDQGIP